METQERITIDWMGVSPRVTRMVMEVADKLGITPTEAIKLILDKKSSEGDLPPALPMALRSLSAPVPNKAA